MVAVDPELPVVWIPVGDEVVVVTSSPDRLEGWTILANRTLSQALSRLGAPSGVGRGEVQVRTFSMRQEHLKFWDEAVRKGADGYSYGMVWGDDSKFLKNLQFKEVVPPVGVPMAPPIDPVQLAVAAAVHQIQRTLDVLDAKLDNIQLAVEWLEKRRQSKQAAELLTAAGALRSVGRRCLAEDEVHQEDLLRVAHLEQIVGTVHREICQELYDVASALHFTDVKSAASSLQLDASRVADLVRLDCFALEALRTYHHLLLLSKLNNSRLGPTEVEATIDDLRTLAEAAHEAVRAVELASSSMRGRRAWEYMLKGGIPAGKAADARMRRKAIDHRSALQAEIKERAAQLVAVEAGLESMRSLDLSHRGPLRLSVNSAA